MELVVLTPFFHWKKKGVDSNWNFTNCNSWMFPGPRAAREGVLIIIKEQGSKQTKRLMLTLKNWLIDLRKFHSRFQTPGTYLEYNPKYEYETDFQTIKGWTTKKHLLLSIESLLFNRDQWFIIILTWLRRISSPIYPINNHLEDHPRYRKWWSDHPYLQAMKFGHLEGV